MPNLHPDGRANEVVGRLAEGLIANPGTCKAYAAHVRVRVVHCCPHCTCARLQNMADGVTIACWSSCWSKSFKLTARRFPASVLCWLSTQL